MNRAHVLLAGLLGAGLFVASGSAGADGPKPAPPPAPPAPPTVVHVPADELDVLLRMQGRGMLVRYAEYRALLEAAKAKDASDQAAPPKDAVRLSGEGTLDLTDEKAARFALVYRVRGLAAGPRSLGWESGGAAFESVLVEPEAGAGPGRYEEKDGKGRLWLDGPGVRKVTVTGSAVPTAEGGRRLLDLWLPSPAAMAIAVTLPPGVEATLTGEGVPLQAASPAEKPLVVTTRPTRQGNLKIAWAQAAKGTEGPSVLDAEVKTLHTVGDGVVVTQALVRTDVLRTPTDVLVLGVPADLTVHKVEGAGVTGSTRSEDRATLTVRLEKPVLGAVQVLLQGERPYRPGPGVDLARVTVVGALRHRGEAALRFGADVNARGVTVDGGRRVAVAGDDPALAGVLRYVLARADARLTVDVEPGRARVDATSTYYLNLAEPGQTVIATVTYRVAEGSLFRLSPRFGPELDLRELTLNGATTGFTRDRGPDGRVEVTLAKALPVGGEVLLQAVLERARADWVPEKGAERVVFAVPSAGATREEGYVAVGADAGFEVLDTEAKDLLPVGAADLTARGLSAAGLVYGYRLDGPAPSVTLDVTRREPLLEAEVVTRVHPGPRRIDLQARAVFRIQRAGVRRLFVDLPASAGEQVDWFAPWFRAAHRLKDRPADVPEGYDRWQVDLEQRVTGTHVVTARWFLDRAEENWTLPASERLAARAPVERAGRLLVVLRSQGLEVSLPTLASSADVRTLDVADLPPEAAGDVRRVLEVLRLPPTRDGIDLAVKKHTGAAVLDAVATELRLETAVAAEGILRTKASVELFNVDRQFVDVALPPGSSLIGAVVDGKPAKPLVDPQGVLLVTVAPTRPTREDPHPRTRVVLTYETRLEGPLGGRVTVPSPRFPGLEVLHTTHEVGFEEDVQVVAVGGDLLPRGRVERPTRAPWLVAFGRAMGGGAGAERFSIASEAPASGPRFDDNMPYSTSPANKADPWEAWSAKPGHADYGSPGGAVPPAAREPSDPSAPPPADGPTTPAPTTLPPVAEVPPAPPSPSPGTAAGLPVRPGGRGMGGGGGGAHGGDAERDREARRGDGKAGRAGPGEGGEPREAAPGSEGGKAKKGQLSLDVPVYLAPRRVVTQRIGGGGDVEIDLVSVEASRRGYLFLGLLALCAGLLVVGRGWLPGWLTVVAGLTAALALHLSLGAPAANVASALADAMTLLAGLLALRWLAVKAFARPARVAPPPAAGSGPAAAATAALLLVAWAGFAAVPAHADDEPAPETSPVENPGGTVVVPHDPAKGGALAPEDRVFVPLATWLDLQKKAHPERDPELVALGQVVTLVETTWRLDVGATSADGTARLVFAQRGRGTLLVALPLSGVAITEARLDGQPLRLLLDRGVYRVPLEREGDHVLDLVFQVPVAAGPTGRSFAFDVPTFVAATVDVFAGEFDGELRVAGAGRVVVLGSPAAGEEFHARAYVGRRVGAGASTNVQAVLAEKTPAQLPSAVRTRAESRTVHSVRDGGTETVVSVGLHVLQGRAPFVDLALPEGVDVLEASGPNVERWETSDGRLRLVFNAPAEGLVPFRVRTFRPAAQPERRETVPELAVRDTTGESGVLIVNGDPTLRVEGEAGPGLFRTGRPGEPDAAGPDGKGRVAGAWRFAARPAALDVTTSRAQPRLEVRSRARVTFGDDRVRTVLEGTVSVVRAQVGDLAFALPGTDEVRSVEGPRLQTWWTEGEGEARRLLVRYADLVDGDHPLTVRLERRLGGQRDGLTVPRWRLAGAQADRGVLVLFALPDVEPSPGATEGLTQLAPGAFGGHEPNVPGARATHGFRWESAVEGALPVVLRTPEQEVEAVVVSQVAPSDEEQHLEHLVLFDVRRGSTDRLTLFVPDGGLSANDVVRARDLREVRSERVVKADPDGKDVPGLLYTVRLQSAKSGIVEVTVAQLWPAGRTVRVVRPEGVRSVRWFGIVRKFLDGEVDVRVSGGSPDKADWADLPFVPTGVDLRAVHRLYVARAPYTLDVTARRFALQSQADAFVLAAGAEVVVGLDGEARVRATYRLFNRARQFLRLRLPEGAVLYGAVAARQVLVRTGGGRVEPLRRTWPVKPLAGTEGTVLLPIPKVPLGEAAYEVALTYRARVGPGFTDGGKATLLLPEVKDVAVDRTAITLHVPDGFDWTFDTSMTPAQAAEVAQERIRARLEEVRRVLEVTEKGALEQRIAACDNGAPLIEEVRRELEDLSKRLTSQGGALGRATAALELQNSQLAAQLGEVTRIQKEAQEQCAVDAGVLRNDLQVQWSNAVGANGQTLLQLDPAGDGQRDVTLATAVPAPPTGANWRFNPLSVPEDKAGKKDLLDLKERFRGELEKRAAEETRKSVDVQQEGQSRAARAQDAAKAPPVPRQTVQDEETQRYDENRNNENLNAALRRVQTESRQLGADLRLQAQWEALDWDATESDLRGVGGGNLSGWSLERARQKLDPAAAMTFGYREDADALITGIGGAEIVRDADLGDGQLSGRSATYEAATAGPDTRAGLMGVDVPLPKEGRVYWFTSARSGASLEMSASPEGPATWARALLAFVLLGALGYALFLVARRRRLGRRGQTPIVSFPPA